METPGMPPIDLLLTALVIANVAAFGLFWLDKIRAREHGRRVRESKLLQLAVVGGFGAWLGQHLLRHKTRKEPFRSQLGLVLILHAVAVAGAVFFILR